MKHYLPKKKCGIYEQEENGKVLQHGEGHRDHAGLMLCCREQVLKTSLWKV